jgi:alkane 1-monooxygenase
MKPYQTLCSYEDSPTLPHGYVVCIILALFPKTWFDIMDPLVDEYYKNNEQKGA